MTEFFHMGGYAAFVWPCFAVSIVVLVLAAVLTLRAHARAERVLARLDETE